MKKMTIGLILSLVSLFMISCDITGNSSTGETWYPIIEADLGSSNTAVFDNVVVNCSNSGSDQYFEIEGFGENGEKWHVEFKVDNENPHRVYSTENPADRVNVYYIAAANSGIDSYYLDYQVAQLFPELSLSITLQACIPGEKLEGSFSGNLLVAGSTNGENIDLSRGLFRVDCFE